MDTFHVIKNRRSVRKFQNKKIPDEVLYAIFDAAHAAPAAGNYANWRFLVIESEAGKKTIAKAAFNQDWLAKAPVLVLACSESGKLEKEFGERGKALYAVQNVATAAQNLMLAAHNFGVASCWIGAFTENIIRREFRIPDPVDIHAIVALGYGDEKPKPPSRQHFADVIYFEMYGREKRTTKESYELSEEFVPRVRKEVVKHVKKAVEEVKKRAKKPGKKKVAKKKPFFLRDLPALS